ncbi:S9 family peptidase [Paucibacter aquatile]|uniref:S9 family peptidase n=1 Tax=Kinneretia aquatilis TaxID=2070761 RepID=A0A2N8L0S6_9BURK|nr:MULTISPECIES: S9 family peptidase [Roseateles]PND39285.1 S9 family peptidase [Paucibacter aquatile]WIV98380.1 S9 family peptidase [Paucibacter aquatile]
MTSSASAVRPFAPTLLALASLALSATLTQSAVAATANARGETPLIARSALFGNPVKSGAQLSPDGQWLSWMAPVNGVMNVWVAPADKPEAAKAVTDSKDRPIPGHFWSGNSEQVLFIKDNAGDENFRLYGVDLKSGQQRDYTPYNKVRVRMMARSNTRPDELLIGINNRDPRWHDVHLLNLKTGELKLLMQGDGFAGFLGDDDLNVRMALRPNAAGGQDFFPVQNGKTADKPVLSTTLEDSATSPLGYTRDGKTLYWMDSRERDTTALFAEDVASGKRTLLAEDARADLGASLRDPVSGVIQAYAVDYLQTEWKFLDKTLKADFDWLQKQLGQGEVIVSSRTRADDKWIVGIDPVSKVAATYLYDRKAKKLQALYVARPELQDAPLVPMQGLEIKARDGLILPSYLSLPKEADKNGDGKADKPVPLVLFVHGGPWARDGHGYNGYHQWLANRGYAVLSVNFRASTGFGKKFLNAGNKQWGLAMHNDLLDAVDWAVKQGVTTKDKVAIMGGSYGGYAALAGVAFTPTTFACAVDIVGPSNLETLLSTIPPYWEAGKKQMYSRMGDPTTEEGKAILRAASPLYKADQIVRPLLIGQGANDPRVKQAESDQIVQAMQAKKIPVTYVLYPDEGHGFNKPNNRIGFNAVAEAFLGQCLGGRVEPLGETVRQSTAQIVTGAEHVPGLEAAAKK